MFLLPGCLQFDISFTPASEFLARGPKFRMLFGSSAEKQHVRPPSAHELFGYAVHHAVRARFCIERRRCWQAEYWISGVRDYALGLAVVTAIFRHVKGGVLMTLPSSVKDASLDALIVSLKPDELLRALSCAIELPLGEADEVREFATSVQLRLRTCVESLTEEEVWWPQ